MIELLYLVDLGGENDGEIKKLFNFTVISNLSVKLSCVRICMLCSCMSL